ncbi:3-phenylpropionate/cinnamic acid dioxygenase subunit beta [Sphingobium chlorophenolicum]|uniref:Biphenyl 2,3-dioxygenase n=1 Tax=Sphingobium chlorophenolicum TaxID=46429 RepID=A0A081RAE7_SPHCR|nr:3-phenylpropionate/cinnamic acid dioxygenase subunit beta [Sphingobium chlorophenolicum]KEQ52170.1 Biphenyl 2,3-dioxygenase [Sphingobium chlorophenolicum]
MSAAAQPEPGLSMEEARHAALRLMDLHGQGPEVDDLLLRRIERFCNREARLLDEERYDEWYGLLADDLFYWMPLRENRYRRDRRGDISPDNMAFFDESKADIALRLGRINSNLAWTEDPPTRHVYIVSNIEAFETAVDGEYEVHSTFIQYRNRVEHDEVTLCGRRRDILRAVDGGFQIVGRMILLPQSVLLAKNLSVFF